MKRVFNIFIVLLLQNICLGQVDYSKDWGSLEEYDTEYYLKIDVTKKVIYKNDLSYVLKSGYPEYSTQEAIMPLYGLLGNDFKKIEFVFTAIEKNSRKKNQYTITGKTYLNNRINNFKGRVTFKKAIAYVPKDEENQQTKVVLIGSYKLHEKQDAKSSDVLYIGKIKMVLFTNTIYTDEVVFNVDRQYYEEGAVRGFVGVRKNYGNKTSKSCIWGFTRFPNSYANGFDIGDGEPVINLKYAKPWFNYSSQKWNNIVNGYDKKFYIHSSKNDKGIQVSNDEYIKPEEATWYKLSSKDIENKVVKFLKLNSSNIEFISQKQYNINEVVVVIGERENETLSDNYALTSHIVIINSVTGKIKNYFSEESSENGWVSNAIFIDTVSIASTLYELNETKKAFGVIVSFKSSSQPNPYAEENLSLFVKDKDSFAKVLDTYTIYESSGEVNVSVNACYANFSITKKELLKINTKTNGYYDIVVNGIRTERTFSIDKTGECNPVEKEVEKTEKVLKFNGNVYK